MLEAVINNKILNSKREQVRRIGWTMAFEEGPSVPCSYTVGLDLLEHPDLVMVGIKDEVASTIIEACAMRVLSGERFDPGLRKRDVLQGLDVEIRPVSTVNTHWLPVAEQIYREKGRKLWQAVQIVWPDEQGRFPWDRGWSDRYDQPLLSLDRVGVSQYSV